jgi:hypothetical protein
MLVANCLKARSDLDLRKLFDNNMRGEQAPYGIQNIADIGLRHFRVYPGEWYGINQMSQIMEMLTYQYEPVKGFAICTF